MLRKQDIKSPGRTQKHQRNTVETEIILDTRESLNNEGGGMLLMEEDDAQSEAKDDGDQVSISSYSNREYLSMFRRFIHDQFGENVNFDMEDKNVIPEMPSMLEHD